ncbi:MAG: hypothetical protein H6624_10880 [Bdellovibrionaceae bacterium]|nr:hypothetical protein [Bdellovibrionales bacterium]MCB9084841.1 hypothetical protein [Pseudobdellovibrionaceae bacterium]
MEELYAKSGDRVLRIGEKYLCSRIDPKVEAERWLAGHRDQITKSKGLVILGLGAGYHVALLRKRYPTKQIVIFEQSERCRQFAEKLFPLELFDTPILTGNDESAITEDHSVQRLLAARYSILSHPASVDLNLAWYEKIREQLLGRTLSGFRLQLASHPSFSSMGQKPLLWLNEVPVNWRIFDPMDSGGPEEISDQDFFIIKTLRELIK